jgi:hypothetical protein
MLRLHLVVRNYTLGRCSERRGHERCPIYGVTALDVAPDATSQGVAPLRQYRDGALKQAGNTGVTLLQEAD